jgi:hypothetical protein
MPPGPQKLRALLATELPAHVWTGDAAATCVRIVPIFRLTFRSMAEVLAEARAMYARARFLFLPIRVTMRRLGCLAAWG